MSSLAGAAGNEDVREERRVGGASLLLWWWLGSWAVCEASISSALIDFLMVREELRTSRSLWAAVAAVGDVWARLPLDARFAVSGATSSDAFGSY